MQIQALADKKRMHEEAKALELKKREELRAEQLQSTAEVSLSRPKFSPLLIKNRNSCIVMPHEVVNVTGKS